MAMVKLYRIEMATKYQALQYKWEMKTLHREERKQYQNISSKIVCEAFRIAVESLAWLQVT